MYKISACAPSKRKRADALVLPVWESKKGPLLATSAKEYESLVKFPFSERDFLAKPGKTQLLYTESKLEPRLLLLGLGKEEECTPEILRRAYATIVKALPCHAIESVNIVFPELKKSKPELFERAAAEGVLLASYTFEQFKAPSEKRLLKEVCFCGHLEQKAIDRLRTLMGSVYFTCDLVNGNADDINVEFLKKTALEMAKKERSLKVSILGRKELEKEKMGLLLAVNRGANSEPAVIILEYKGNPSSKKRVALVGKGVTYDTGGLNLKVSGSGMETMKCDMAGAAAVLGTMQAASALKLPVNLIGAIGVTENGIGPASYKPGDVYRSHYGKTVEISNTDAEGRLVLADTISYIEKEYNPSHVIDLATLTGSVVIALGEEASGLFTNDDKLAVALEEAGEHSGEKVWHLPLYPAYKDYLKSSIADLKNAGVRKASAAQGAIFIAQFVTTAAWAHLDIAGTAFLSDPHPCYPTPATGVGVRLLIDFLERGKW